MLLSRPWYTCCDHGRDPGSDTGESEHRLAEWVFHDVEKLLQDSNAVARNKFTFLYGNKRRYEGSWTSLPFLVELYFASWPGAQARRLLEVQIGASPWHSDFDEIIVS